MVENQNPQNSETTDRTVAVDEPVSILSASEGISADELDLRAHGLSARLEVLLSARRDGDTSSELQDKIDKTTVEWIYTNAAKFNAQNLDKPRSE